MANSIPVIDIADYMAGSVTARDSAADQVREALTTVGFFVLTGHDVPRASIDRTFAAAARLHDLPMAKKIAAKMNEHTNGYMAMKRYAVWTSDVNDNDRPDLNEAFFIRRERAADDPVRTSGQRFLGPNVWPEEADLPGFRADALAYIDTMEAFALHFLPVAAAALDLESTWFDAAFTDSFYGFRPLPLSPGRGRGEPVRYRPALGRQFPDLPRPDRDSRPTGPYARRRMAGRALYSGARFAVNSGRHPAALVETADSSRRPTARRRRSGPIAMPSRSSSARPGTR